MIKRGGAGTKVSRNFTIHAARDGVFSLKSAKSACSAAARSPAPKSQSSNSSRLGGGDAVQ